MISQYDIDMLCARMAYVPQHIWIHLVIEFMKKYKYVKTYHHTIEHGVLYLTINGFTSSRDIIAT